jgi:hypothetical protein
MRWRRFLVSLCAAIAFGGASRAAPPLPLVLRDYDGDGGHDLTFVGRVGMAAEGFVRLQILDGLVPGAAAFLPTAGGAFALAGAGDVDGDGVTDLVFQGVVGTPAQGTLRIDFIDPVGPSVASRTFVADGNGAWRLFDLADLDGDGRMDLVFVGTHGTAAEGWVRLLVMNGAVPAASGHFSVAGLGTTLVGVADANGDGRDDLITETPTLSGDGFYVSAHLTYPSGTSAINFGGALVVSSPEWSLAGIGRASLNRDGVGPIVVAVTRTISDTEFELQLFGRNLVWSQFTNWPLLHQRVLTGTPPFEMLGFANVNGDSISDAMVRHVGGSLVERPGAVTPIQSGPPFALTSAGDVDDDGRWDLIYEGEGGGAAEGVLRIDRSGPTGFPAERGWIPTGGGAWQLF